MDSLAIGLATQALERAASESYQCQVVRHRLNKISNVAVNMYAELRKVKMRQYSDRYIRHVDTAEGCTLQSTKDMSEAFRWHF